ncbi:ABC transporter ATP-binding protein [Clostridium sp. WB02_MRS01]|uniref:ABC transporter ATP-binding protein n=1 Tax=Clostridium sp. WB02_MRS01 TaxID=2605777 RepID=UPI0012B24DAB|nr:ABC transporter ATP-binding protein [Clostridium sp. WB02_MRS01]MSS07189.1 ABC transporter ATP-binding protein [Clostridium sp. WB02_MRS01]
MIEFKNIEIKYGNFTAIKELNLTIKDGEFFTFLGPSGCGKTTTLRSLVGFIEPSAGQIIIDGKDVTHTPVEERKIGMVFQSYALFPTMTVYENLAFGLKVKKYSAAEIDRKVKEVAKVIEVKEEHLVRNVSELSGGQQQRVALARAIVLEPKILCLDEPLSNLDAKLRVGLRSELKKLQKNLGITTLYVTHDQEEALTLSDRIAVFNNGFVEQVDKPYDIYNHSKSEFVCDFIGEINRLNEAVIDEIKRQTNYSLDRNKNSYIRLERISLKEVSGYKKLSGIIRDYDYNGVMTKYSVDVMGCMLRVIHINDGKPFLKPGQKLDLFIEPKDIMQF